ncbi:MarR family transcriptional regulator [Microbacterium sp. A8/3-1]|uniref:MarR family transcriptional regulator n=1 Tax=Microbacterium sp. A8/3-1 TaxID=3160749 RepID=A0AAU7VUM3_9MICO
MTAAEHTAESPEERADAVRSLEAEFSGLITNFRRIIMENANRVSPGMLPGAYKTLTTIAHCETVTASALAERMLMDKGQVSRTLRELEELGLVERSPDPRDGRSSLLRLTGLGIERLAAARLPQEGVLLQTLQDWSIDDIGNLSRMLHALASGVSPGATT